MKRVHDLTSWPYMIIFVQLWRVCVKGQATEAAHPAVLSWQHIWALCVCRVLWAGTASSRLSALLTAFSLCPKWEWAE